MVWKCQVCNAENEEKEQWCLKCGAEKGLDVSGGPSDAQLVQQPVDQPSAQAQQVQPSVLVQASEARLQLVSSSVQLASEFVVTNGKTLGRALNNDIILPDPYISRTHAKLVFENGSYVIEDLNSTHGTFLNGNDIRGKGKQQLKDSDEIKMGTTVFRLKLA